MNSLSWLLYAADVSATVRFSAPLFWAIGLMAMLLSAILYAIQIDTSLREPHREGLLSAAKAAQKVGTPLLVVAVLTLFAPTRNTVMLIAASQVGETVLASEQAQAIGGEAGELATDSLRVLRKFINEQLETGKEP